MSKEDIYNEILKSAYELFATKGYEKATLSMIAKNVGISKPALYYYFPSKENLFEELYKHIIESLIEEYNKRFYPSSKEEWGDIITKRAFSDIHQLKEKSFLASILSQYSLLAKRSQIIKTQLLNLNESMKDYYHHYSEIAAELEIIPLAQLENLENLLLVLDLGTSEISDHLTENQLKGIWEMQLNILLNRNS